MRKHLAGSLAALGLAASFFSVSVQAAECPNNGVVRFGVEPYESAALLLPVYQELGQALSKKLGCKVVVQVTTNYTAEIEAMRHGNLEVAEFGPLGYVFAHKLAGADAVATFSNKQGKPDTYTASIVTWPGSGLKTLQDVRGKSFAYSDPASTSGHLFPSYGLKSHGIDPEKGVRAFYAGTHTASYEALRHHKVLAGELNSEQIQAAMHAGIYSESDFTTLWQSAPIPDDPITVRSDLPQSFKQRFVEALLSIDFKALSDKAQKTLLGSGDHFVATDDAAYSQIRDVVKTMGLKLNNL